MRAFFALVVWDIFPYGLDLTGQPKPVGLARWGVDFTFFSNPAFFSAARTVLAVSLVLYVIGRYLWLVLPFTLFIIVGAGTLEASQGKTAHSTVLVALLVVTQTVYYIWARVARGSAGRFFSSERRRLHATGAFSAMQTIAAAYVVSAISKIAGEGNWLVGAMKNYPLQMVKTERQNFYNTLEPESVTATRHGIIGKLAEWTQPLGSWLEQMLMNSAAWRGVLLGSGFLLELVAFVALIGRRCSALVGISLILFHFAIYLVMGLKFQYHMALVLIFFVNLPYWIRSIRKQK